MTIHVGPGTLSGQVSFLRRTRISRLRYEVQGVTVDSRDVHTKAMEDQITVACNKEALASTLAKSVVECFRKWNVENGRCVDKFFSLALSGGSLPRTLAELSKPEYKNEIAWSKCRIFFADERCVPLTHPDSNFKACWDAFLRLVEIPEANVVTIDPTKEPHECADLYAAKLEELPMRNGLPIFDLILLGMGPDGHTASLFPEHALLLEEKRSVAAILDSPKPPSCRITLTLPVLNNSSCVIFVTGGSEKAPVLAKILTEKSSEFPAGRVKPSYGKVLWLLDTEAASRIPEGKL